jgi:hypothetical protein
MKWGGERERGWKNEQMRRKAITPLEIEKRNQRKLRKSQLERLYKLWQYVLQK